MSVQMQLDSVCSLLILVTDAADDHQLKATDAFLPQTHILPREGKEKSVATDTLLRRENFSGKNDTFSPWERQIGQTNHFLKRKWTCHREGREK